jgi:hypothetical protein
VNKSAISLYIEVIGIPVEYYCIPEENTSKISQWEQESHGK